jgi:hypothetical protein
MNDRCSLIDPLAYRRGKIDFLANAPTPYTRGSKEFYSWLSGWQSGRQHTDKSHVIAIRMPRT